MYVLWHPACTDGPTLGSEIYRWLRVGFADQLGNGAGIPVYYRSEAEPTPPADAPVDPGPFLPAGELPDRAPRPIRFDEAVLNVLVPLVDARLVASAAWREWLATMATPGSDRLVLPVELHPSAARLPLLTDRNPIRVTRWDDPAESDEARRTRWARRLRRHLTQALLTHLASSEGASRRASVFLSHAKRDGANGVGIAEQIRATALTLGQVDTFFDASSLDWGRPWAPRLREGAARHTAALIALVSDSYASRPWCREELRLAREPHRVGDTGDDAQIWTVQPVVALHAGDQRWTRVIPELAGTPSLAWRGPESAEDVLDRAVLEALLGEVHLRYARLLAGWMRDQAQATLGGETAGTHFLTWTPDPWTLDRWLRALGAAPVTRLVYPSHALGAIDEARLRDAVPPGVELASLDDLHLGLALPPARSPTPPVQRVLISGSLPEDRAVVHLGVGREHLTEAFYRVARTVFRQGLGVAYGGALLGNNGPALLPALADAAQAALLEHAPSAPPSPVDGGPAATPGTRPTGIPTLLTNHLGWFPDGGATPAQEAELVGICDIERVRLPPEVDARARRAELTPYWKARGLWEVRQRMAASSLGAVLMGGRATDFHSFAPGLIEELAAMHGARRSVWVFSGFGGVAAELARWLDADGPPPHLDLEAALRATPAPRLRATLQAAERELGAAAGRAHVEAHYADLRSALQEWRAEVLRGPTYGGLPMEEYLALARSESIRELRRRLLGAVGDHLLATARAAGAG